MNVQEEFWRGSFGDEYITRNDDVQTQAASLHLFGQIAPHLVAVGSALELGANIGLNLRALRGFFPGIQLSAVEINARACERLRQDGVSTVNGSLLTERVAVPHDLAFTAGVLIHIAPEDLISAYAALYEQSTRFIMIAEYYARQPEQVVYRGESERMWKRDFAGDLMDMYSDLELRAYGCTYHRDTMEMDDLNWFLLEKN